MRLLAQLQEAQCERDKVAEHNRELEAALQKSEAALQASTQLARMFATLFAQVHSAPDDEPALALEPEEEEEADRLAAMLPPDLFAAVLASDGD